MTSATVKRSARVLVGFLVLLIAIGGLAATGKTWQPKLGLDLQGGTRITLVAERDGVSEESLAEAADIIDRRVNGSGVTEADVTTQGDQMVVVEVPGENRRELVDTVKRQAQLFFRVVAAQSSGQGTSLPTGPQTQGGGAPTTETPQSEAPRPAPFTDAQPSPSPSAAAEPEPDELISVEAALAFMQNPPANLQAEFSQFSCPPAGTAPDVTDNPGEPLITCDENGLKYLLSPAVLAGSNLDGADAGVPQNQLQWVVNLDLDGKGTEVFADLSREMVGTGRQFAMVLDGTVLSAPQFTNAITNGQASIDGGAQGFAQDEATALATSLKFGSLPVKFEEQPRVETIGPSLAGNQLSAGIVAGIVGLLLVMLYCILYYRGLGTVIIGSLLAAGAMAYGLVLILSETAGFTLTLPGIAGLIVAVGITADSFIVLFERIKDEMRDGISMPVAVERGWLRARRTALAADAVSLLAAVVIYIFAAGVVKGFAFALGLTTLIDLMVFFWFTKPAVTYLAKYTFFRKGHRFSGLSAETLGIDRINTAGGRA